MQIFKFLESLKFTRIPYFNRTTTMMMVTKKVKMIMILRNFKRSSRMAQ